MPVQKSRKTPSKRGMHRSHDRLARPALSIDPQSGETHLRHCITPDGFYRGKRVIEKPAEARRAGLSTSPIAELPLAVDAMSGDGGLAPRVAGTLLALREQPDLRVILVGDPDAIATQLAATDGALAERIEVRPATQVVTMDEPARAAVRSKKQSSMRIAIDLVREQRAAACVSAGNTGALIAIAHFVLRTVEGVERAAIMSAIPSLGGHTHMLDLGANATVTPLQLAQFASMGSIVARDVHGIRAPRVGLLNIGAEDIKGHETVQQAHRLLSASDASGMDYRGFVEGHDIFSGKLDVVVTDGFTGNIALKTAEGLAHLVRDRMRVEFGRAPVNRFAALLAGPALERMSASLDPARYNGACMVGLRGVVVKSHGRADAAVFSRAVQFASQAVRQRLPALIGAALGSGVT